MTEKKLNVIHLAIVIFFSVIVGLVLKDKFKGDWFEFAGFVTGVVGVYLVSVAHILNWPVGLANVALTAYVCFVGRLYADVSLQFFFFALGVQGWFMWARGGENKTELAISRIPKSWWVSICVAIAVGTAIYYPIIKHFNGAAPFIDSVLTVTSIAAQLLLNAKKVENWILWIVVDIVYIPLFQSRGLTSFAVLFAIFLVIAISGLIRWNKTFKASTS
jgi:nicotinamide mononucleotide transporter